MCVVGTSASAYDSRNSTGTIHAASAINDKKAVTVDPPLSEHHGTRGSLDMLNVRISETIYFLLEQIGILIKSQ